MVDWNKAWLTGTTPWDAGKPTPTLRSMVDSGNVPIGRALVPGCGSGYDLVTLAHPDRTVVGLDLSPVARDAFVNENKQLPGTVHYEVADFFSYAPEAGFDFVWDYTFFCALNPDQRSTWGETMARLLKPNGILATLIFPYADPVPDTAGPPWPINEKLVRASLPTSFERIEFAKATASHPGREDREWLARWILRR